MFYLAMVPEHDPATDGSGEAGARSPTVGTQRVSRTEAQMRKEMKGTK